MRACVYVFLSICACVQMHAWYLGVGVYVNVHARGHVCLCIYLGRPVCEGMSLIASAWDPAALPSGRGS